MHDHLRPVRTRAHIALRVPLRTDPRRHHCRHSGRRGKAPLQACARAEPGRRREYHSPCIRPARCRRLRSSAGEAGVLRGGRARHRPGQLAPARTASHRRGRTRLRHGLPRQSPEPRQFPHRSLESLHAQGDAGRRDAPLSDRSVRGAARAAQCHRRIPASEPRHACESRVHRYRSRNGIPAHEALRAVRRQCGLRHRKHGIQEAHPRSLKIPCARRHRAPETFRRPLRHRRRPRYGSPARNRCAAHVRFARESLPHGTRDARLDAFGRAALGL